MKRKYVFAAFLAVALILNLGITFERDAVNVTSTMAFASEDAKDGDCIVCTSGPSGQTVKISCRMGANTCVPVACTSGMCIAP